MSSLAAKSNCKMPLVSLSLAYLSRGVSDSTSNQETKTNMTQVKATKSSSQDESQAQRRALVAKTPSVSKVGSSAPAFSLPSDSGATVSLKDYEGKRVVLFFILRTTLPAARAKPSAFKRPGKLSRKRGRWSRREPRFDRQPLWVQGKAGAKISLSCPIPDSEVHKSDTAPLAKR